VTFAIILYGQCCSLHVVGQQVVNDISVIRSYEYEVSVRVFEFKYINLLVRLRTAVLGTSTLLQMANIVCPTTWRRVLGDYVFSDVTAPCIDMMFSHNVIC